jgi:hypothetical protein
MASLYFEKGKLLTATRKDDNVPLTDLLVRKGKLTPVQAEQAAQAHQNQNGASMSQLVIDLNLIGRDELQRCCNSISKSRCMPCSAGMRASFASSRGSVLNRRRRSCRCRCPSST